MKKQEQTLTNLIDFLANLGFTKTNFNLKFRRNTKGKEEISIDESLLTVSYTTNRSHETAYTAEEIELLFNISRFLREMTPKYLPDFEKAFGAAKMARLIELNILPYRFDSWENADHIVSECIFNRMSTDELVIIRGGKITSGCDLTIEEFTAFADLFKRD